MNRPEPRQARTVFVVSKEIPAAAIPDPVPLRPVACTKCGAATEPRPGGLCSYCTIKAGAGFHAIGLRTRFA